MTEEIWLKGWKSVWQKTRYSFKELRIAGLRCFQESHNMEGMTSKLHILDVVVKKPFSYVHR